MSDEDALIVARGRTAYVLLNLFPYNSGHLLVCPYRHIATYDQATDEEVAEIGALTQQAMRVLRTVSRCDGFNIGMNQGSVAGAGIDEHLHQHIVPRWAIRRELLPDHRQDQGAPAAARRRPHGRRRRLARLTRPTHPSGAGPPPTGGRPRRRARHPTRTRIDDYDREHPHHRRRPDRAGSSAASPRC